MRSLFTLSLIAAALFAPALPQADAAETAPAVETVLDESAPVDGIEDTLVRRSLVFGRSMDRWTVTLRAGVTYRIVVDGDGDSDLDAFLRDENGGLIDRDVDGTDYCILSVTPRWTGPFTIEVHNLGHVANVYQLRITP